MVQTSCHLDEYNSSYDLKNRNYSNLGDCSEIDFKDRIVTLLRRIFWVQWDPNLDILISGKFVFLKVYFTQKFKSLNLDE